MIPRTPRSTLTDTLFPYTTLIRSDFVRVIMLTRKNDATLDFDLVEVMEQSRDNPVFYVQYCHARCRSILRHAAAEMPGISLDPVALAGSDLNRLTDSGELALIKDRKSVV